MNKELREAALMFCDMMPNLDDLHHPLDCRRLLHVVYLAIKNEEDVPIDFIKEKLSEKTFLGLNGGTVESFMESCEKYISNAKSILIDAQNLNILK